MKKFNGRVCLVFLLETLASSSLCQAVDTQCFIRCFEKVFILTMTTVKAEESRADKGCCWMTRATYMTKLQQHPWRSFCLTFAPLKFSRFSCKAFHHSSCRGWNVNKELEISPSSLLARSRNSYERIAMYVKIKITLNKHKTCSSEFARHWKSRELS